MFHNLVSPPLGFSCHPTSLDPGEGLRPSGRQTTYKACSNADCALRGGGRVTTWSGPAHLNFPLKRRGVAVGRGGRKARSQRAGGLGASSCGTSVLANVFSPAGQRSSRPPNVLAREVRLLLSEADRGRDEGSRAPVRARKLFLSLPRLLRHTSRRDSATSTTRSGPPRACQASEEAAWRRRRARGWEKSLQVANLSMELQLSLMLRSMGGVLQPAGYFRLIIATLVRPDSPPGRRHTHACRCPNRYVAE